MIEEFDDRKYAISLIGMVNFMNPLFMHTRYQFVKT